MNAIASAIGFALVPLAKDPNLIWNYGVVAILAAFGGTMFWLQFRGMDKDEDRLNMLPSEADVKAAKEVEPAEVDEKREIKETA